MPISLPHSTPMQEQQHPGLGPSAPSSCPLNVQSSLISAAISHPVTRAYASLPPLHPAQLIYPVFVHGHPHVSTPIASLPGQMRHGVERLKDLLAPLVGQGLAAVLLFGVVDGTGAPKDARGSGADGPDSPVMQAIQRIKRDFPNLLVIVDVCLCAYTDHGHCGILREASAGVAAGRIDVQQSIDRLAQVSVAYALAGADVIAPSDMMDGRIRAIKEALHCNALTHIPVMAYSAKFASSFYGPFRDACSSSPHGSDRKSYQLPPGSRGLAKRALARDIQEGADFLMVKPGLPYLDIIREAADMSVLPVVAYQVSGEYAMLWHAAQAGVCDLREGVLESIESMRRAGAGLIISYYTPMLLEWMAAGGRSSS